MLAKAIGPCGPRRSESHVQPYTHDTLHQALCISSNKLSKTFHRRRESSRLSPVPPLPR